MFLLEIAIISIIIGLIRKGSIKNFFIGGLRGWYIFLVSIVLFMSQKILAIAGVTALNDYAFWITIAAYILLFIGLFLNLEGIWTYGLLIGALMNFVIIVLNSGLMPVSETALSVAGLGTAIDPYMTKFSSTMAVATDSTIFLWKYLGAIIPLPLPSILGEVLTPGTVVMALSSFGFIQSIMTTQYMDEEEYENYMKELSSEDKKDNSLLDNTLENKKASDDNAEKINDNDLDYTQNISSEDKQLLEANEDDHTFDELKNDLDTTQMDDATDDFFADFELDDLNEKEMNEEAQDAINEEDLLGLEEEGSKLEDEDLLKELEDEFNENETVLFNDDESMDELLEDAFGEEEKEEDSLIDSTIPIAAASGIAAAGLLAAANEEETKEPNLEDLLNEALGEDEDEDIDELLKELRSLSNEDNIDSIMDLDDDFDEMPQEETTTEDELANEGSGVDYDFFKEADDTEEVSEVEDVTKEDFEEISEYEQDDELNIVTKEDDDIDEAVQETAPSNNIKDAKEILKKVGVPKSKPANTVNPMPDVDDENPFIIMDGRIVENPYYKFKKGTSRREDALASPEIDDNGIYVMSGGGLAKIKEGKVEPQVPKETPKRPVRKSNIPNLTSTPSFNEKEDVEEEQKFEQYRTRESDYRRQQNLNSNNYTQRQADRYNDNSPKYQRRNDTNMTIINDSVTGRTINNDRHDYNYPREQVLQTSRDKVLNEDGQEVPNPYEKVEMKIGDVEIKFWKKDNQ